jgi:hypothetical protein
VNGTISQYVEAGSTGHAQLVVGRKYNGWYEREAGRRSVRALSRGWRAPDNQGTTSHNTTITEHQHHVMHWFYCIPCAHIQS